MSAQRDPNTSGGAETFPSLSTRAGRAYLFNQRIDELMRSGLTFDAALSKMRSGGDASDHALLTAMGENPSHLHAEKAEIERWHKNLWEQAERNKNAGKTSPEVAAALKATNDRSVAFNARTRELMDRGFTIDQAILQMRADSKDAALLKAMGA
jgi:hypothetical protein